MATGRFPDTPLMTQTLLRLLLAASVLSLSACAVMRTDGKLDYQPTAGDHRAVIAPLAGTSVRALKVTDARIDTNTRRPLDDPRIVLVLRNPQTYTATVRALDKPLADYTTQAFENGLHRAGVVRSDASPLELRVRLDLTDEPREGFWKTQSWLVLMSTVSVYDHAAGQELARQVIVGQATVRRVGKVLIDAQDYALTLPYTLDDLVDQVLQSPDIRRALGAKS